MTVDPILHHGRPAERREEKEERCYALLDDLGLSYERADHEHADTIEACHAVERVLGCEICKNLLLMPGEKPFKTRILSKQIGTARLSFASAEQMLEHLGVTPGSVSVLGLLNDKEKKVHLLIYRDLLSQPFIGMHPCLNSSTLKIACGDLMDRILPALGVEPRIVDLPWDPDAET